MPRLTDNGYPQWMTPLMPQDVAPEMRRSCWQACLVSGCAFVLAQPWIGRLLPQGQLPWFLSGIAKLLSLFTLSSSTALLWVMLGCLFWLQLREAPFPVQMLSVLGRILSYFILGPAALAL